MWFKIDLWTLWLVFVGSCGKIKAKTHLVPRWVRSCRERAAAAAAACIFGNLHDCSPAPTALGLLHPFAIQLQLGLLHCHVLACHRGSRRLTWVPFGFPSVKSCHSLWLSWDIQAPMGFHGLIGFPWAVVVAQMGYFGFLGAFYVVSQS